MAVGLVLICCGCVPGGRVTTKWWQGAWLVVESSRNSTSQCDFVPFFRRTNSLTPGGREVGITQHPFELSYVCPGALYSLPDAQLSWASEPGWRRGWRLRAEEGL